MLRIRSQNILCSPQTQEVVFLHQPKHSFFIRQISFPAQQCGEPPITALATMSDGELLKPLSQKQILLFGLLLSETTVKA